MFFIYLFLTCKPLLKVHSSLYNIPNNLQTNFSMKNYFDVFLTFLKLGLTSFGGPVAHIAYFRKEFVEQKKWLSEHQFAQLLALCQFIPGPASSQLGFCIGLLKAGGLGAILAFIAFTLPSVILLILFVACLPLLDGSLGQAAIHGLKLVACAVVADAVLGMSKNLCSDIPRKAIALDCLGYFAYGNICFNAVSRRVIGCRCWVYLTSRYTSNKKSRSTFYILWEEYRVCIFITFHPTTDFSPIFC